MNYMTFLSIGKNVLTGSLSCQIHVKLLMYVKTFKGNFKSSNILFHTNKFIRLAAR